MGDDIDALAAAAYAHGEDAIDVAVERIAMMIEVRDEVLKGPGESEQLPGVRADGQGCDRTPRSGLASRRGLAASAPRQG